MIWSIIFKLFGYDNVYEIFFDIDNIFQMIWFFIFKLFGNDNVYEMFIDIDKY